MIFTGLLWSNISIAEKIKPPFAFTADDKIPNSKDGEVLITNKSTEIINEPFWGQPLTKLDYILMQLKHHADNKSKKLKEGKTLGYYFHRAQNSKSSWEFLGKYKDITVNNSVYFNEDIGKIIVVFSIENLGKAKEPMSEICKNIFKFDIIGYPLPEQKMMGYQYHNAILNELFRGDSYNNYNNYLEKIADNLVYVLSLNSEVLLDVSKKDTDMFNMNCWKPDKSDNYIFRKWSLGFRR